MTTPQAPLAADRRPERPVLRIGDAERLQTSVLLSDAAAAGRLTLAELDERLAATTAARTAPELAALVADLPVPEPPRDRGAQLRRAGPALLLLLVVGVLSVAASVRAGFPVLWPFAIALLVLWRRSRGRDRRSRDLQWSR